ncbi:hypothetical protein OE88DRAFT_1731178 [Heliocybe sulcata]|uniref:Cation-transporting P-type ATPase N-terminal domain-containing protein n=1 Tax=Heliocybe sulcata TaxID=5364 RepID=A0A5C3NDN9_9AGAM|nr:hypothetical protein OE88DRAFT_1731178 [Heliocybe sulcata]
MEPTASLYVVHRVPSKAEGRDSGLQSRVDDGKERRTRDGVTRVLAEKDRSIVLSGNSSSAQRVLRARTPIRILVGRAYHGGRKAQDHKYRLGGSILYPTREVTGDLGEICIGHETGVFEQTEDLTVLCLVREDNCFWEPLRVVSSGKENKDRQRRLEAAEKAKAHRSKREALKSKAKNVRQAQTPVQAATMETVLSSFVRPEAFSELQPLPLAPKSLSFLLLLAFLPFPSEKCNPDADADLEHGDSCTEDERNNNVDPMAEIKKEPDEYMRLLEYIDYEAQRVKCGGDEGEGEDEEKEWRVWYAPWKKVTVKEERKRKGSARQLETDMLQGLPNNEITTCRNRFRYNGLESPRENPILKFLSYFKAPVLYVMELAVILAAGLRDWIDFGIIIGIFALNAFLKAGIAMKATGVRNGEEQVIEVWEIVPGDIIVVEEGQTVPADGKVRSPSLFGRKGGEGAEKGV